MTNSHNGQKYENETFSFYNSSSWHYHNHSVWLNLSSLSQNCTKWCIQGRDLMQEMSKAKLNGHTHTFFVLNRLTVNSSGRHWMCITLGLQGSHVTDLPKHAWQEHTLVTAHTVKQVKGRQRDKRDIETEGERERERHREIEVAFHSEVWELAGLRHTQPVRAVYKSQQQNQCKPYAVRRHQGE